MGLRTQAVLATLAILIWHFYQVFFDPDVYPMNWSWWDGRVPLEEYRAEHPLDLEAVLEPGSAVPTDTGNTAPKPEEDKGDTAPLEKTDEP